MQLNRRMFPLTLTLSLKGEGTDRAQQCDSWTRRTTYSDALVRL